MKVFKYEINGDIRMPQGAQLLHVGEQQEHNRLKLFVWALVNPDEPMVRRVLSVIGTGMTSQEDTSTYVGTVQSQSGLVWHVFDQGEVPL